LRPHIYRQNAGFGSKSGQNHSGFVKIKDAAYQPKGLRHPLNKLYIIYSIVLLLCYFKKQIWRM